MVSKIIFVTIFCAVLSTHSLWIHKKTSYIPLETGLQAYKIAREFPVHYPLGTQVGH